MKPNRMIRRKIIKGDIEKKIATAGIISTEFCREIVTIFKPEYIQVDYIRKVLEWVFEYYLEYKKAPKKQIQDIFTVEKDEMKPEQAELTVSFLTRLSKEYEHKGSFNVQYARDMAKDYFDKRSMQLLFERGLGLLIKNKTEKARNSITTYKKVSKDLGNWIDPFDPENVQNFLDKENIMFFRFPNAFGDLVGDLKRSWFASFMAPPKRGKSWWLQETCVQGLFLKLRVLFISLEMSLDMMEERLYKRIGGYSDKDEKLVFPVFDCVRNQEGTCKFSKRTGNKHLLRRDGKVMKNFNPKIDYTPCTACRGTKSYKIAIWWKLSDELNINKTEIKNKIKRFTKIYSNNLRMVSYPAFSATVEDIEMELDNLEFAEGFIPDLIVIDYGDIIGVNDSSLSERGKIDDIWKKLKGMAAIHHCLVFTASQSNRKSIEKRSVSQTDTAEDIRKIAHVDIMIGINQTEDEKIRGEGRLGIVAHRHRFFSTRQVRVLQQLDVGMPFLDSEWNSTK